MKQIIKPQENVIRVLGEQEYHSDVEYKWILYLLISYVEDGVLLHNTLTKETILLSNEERDHIDQFREHLVKHWFYIPNNINDFSLFYTFLNGYRKINNRPTYGKIRLCTVLPTTGCNARCSYCFEAGAKVRSMSIETARDLADWLTPRAAAHVTMKWFGGEPLCNISSITETCKSLINKGVDFHSFIITNGYNFHEVDDDTLVNVWRTRNVQITLDGVGEAYNKIKNYKDPFTDPFTHVIKNMHRLLSLGIRVSVRFNLSPDNYSTLKELADYLANEFKENNGISVYIHPLFENHGELGVLSESQREDLYWDYEAIQEYCDALGISSKRSVRGFTDVHCMADDGRSVVVLPGGELGLCEHHLDDEYYGSIYDGKYDKAVLSSWREKLPDDELCQNCSLRPTCARIRKCPVELPCNYGLIEYRKNMLQKSIIDFYNKYKKEHKDD